MEGLTDKQEIFVREYLIDLNATQAAIRAGYSKNTASVIGYENLIKPHIAEAIREAFSARSKRLEITADRVLQEIAKSAFADPANLFDENGQLYTIHKMEENARRAIASIKVRREKGEVDPDGKQQWDTVTELKLNDKTRNLELLGKHLTLFSEQSRQDGEAEPLNITFNVSEPVADIKVTRGKKKC